MSLGIIIKGINAFNFKKPIDFFFEFLPQIILILIMFGWMDVLIIAKWLAPMDIFYGTQKGYDPAKFTAERLKVGNAPPIIQTTISDYLSLGKTDY